MADGTAAREEDWASAIIGLPDLEVLRSRWDSGKASGLAGELDVSAMVAEERAKKARRR